MFFDADELPEGWTVTAIASLADVVTGSTPSKKNPDFFGNDIPFFKPTDLDAGYEVVEAREYLSELGGSHSRLLPKHTVLVTCIGATIGKIGLARIGCATNQQINAAVVNESFVSPQWLYWMLNSPIGQQLIIDNASATTLPILNKTRFSKLPLPLPPLNEQRRIVTKIEELTAHSKRAREALEDIPTLIEQFKQSVLAAAFRGDLTADWREKNPDVEPASKLLERIRGDRRVQWEAAELEKMRAKGKEPKNDKWKEKYKETNPIDDPSLAQLPESWTYARVAELGRVQLGRQRSPKNHMGEHMRPYLRAANVFEDRIDTSDVMEMNFNPSEFKTFKLIDNDILLNEGQSLELVGRPAIYRGEAPSSCFQNTLVRFQTYKGLLPEYALMIFRAYMHTGRFQQIAQWTTNIAHLGAGRFAQLEFPLPPLSEQQQIVIQANQLLNSISKFYDIQKSNAKDLHQLEQSILSKAFRGELVPQNPNDEPADLLLDRIRAEREKLTTKKKAKRPRKKKNTQQLTLEGTQ